MSDLKRIDKLREYILSEGITTGLAFELVNNTGRDDFFVVFLSVCDKVHRAKVFHGTGNALSDAWTDAEKKLRAYTEHNPINGAWVKADVVTSYEEIPTINLNKLLARNRWVNFMRYGISLERDFTNAFLEAELNGNKVIDYYTPREIAAQAIDYNSNRIHLDSLNRYLVTYYNKPEIKSVPEQVTVFKARGFFCGEDEVIHELYSDNADYGRRRIDIIDSGVIRKTITNASEYIANQVGEDGRFNSGYFPVFDDKFKGYNIVCHASSLWALINLYRMNSNETLIAKIESALGYMERFIKYKDENTAYLIEQKPDGSGEVKLGANSAAIIFYTEYMEFSMNDRYNDIVRVLANGILELQNAKSGEYQHTLTFPGFASKEEFRTIFYDGEATFALSRAYTYIKDKRYLYGARAAVENFIAKDYIKYRDHWVAYSLFEMTKYINDVKYYEFALRYADENLREVYNRETSYHTYLEMLMASWRTYKRALKYNVRSDYIEHYDPTLFAQTIYFRARHMLNGYFYPEYAMYMESPEKIVDSFMVRHHDYRVRINDIRHFISGYFFFNVYYNEVKQYLSDEFIRKLDGTPPIDAVTEEAKAAEYEEYGPPPSMIYHLNSSIPETLTKTERSAVNRMTMFKNSGIKSIIITSKHGINLHRNLEKHGISEEEHENIYDYFQRARRVEPRFIELEELFPLNLYKRREITYENQPGILGYRIYWSKSKKIDQRIAYVQYEDGVLSFINRLDEKKRIVKRCFYDCRGFLSVEKSLDENGRTLMEEYFAPDGEKVMDKYYRVKDDKSVLFLIILKEDGRWLEFLDEDALITHYLDSFLNSDEDFVIVDRNLIYAKALALTNVKVKKAAILHRKHISGSESLTDNILNDYQETFNSLPDFNAVITTTNKQRQDIIRRFNNMSQMYVFPNIITAEYRKSISRIPMTNPLKIISVANKIDKYKRLRHAVSAFSRVVSKIPDAEFHIFGYNEDFEKELSVLISSHGLENSVKLRGYVPDLSEEYMTAKLFVISSSYENFPIGLLEATAHGIPAVSYNVSYGPEDLIDDGKSGFLTSPYPNRLADKIILLLSDKTLYEEFSSNAYAKSFNFDEANVLLEWKKLFARL
ncbi:MAG: glycosyltransferase [Oscillospiraceae bacterium]|nr:glycosyltransferase [Oscillospiraceae bacterium]